MNNLHPEAVGAQPAGNVSALDRLDAFFNERLVVGDNYEIRRAWHAKVSAKRHLEQMHPSQVEAAAGELLCRLLAGAES